MSAGMYGAGQAGGAGQAIFTDDVSLQVFMEHLKRLVSPLPLHPPLACITDPSSIRLLVLRLTSRRARSGVSLCSDFTFIGLNVCTL